MLGLFVLSVFCVAIIINKFVAFRREKSRLLMLALNVKNCVSLDQLALLSVGFKGHIGDDFLTNALVRINQLVDQKRVENKEIVYQDIEQLDLVLSQDIDALILQEEEYLPLLGTSAAVAPLMGLFGTIWGLVNAFISIGQEKSADISVIAPGIAAALLTTLAGLIVAIPALIMFNYFSNELRKIEGQLCNMQDIILMTAKQALIK